MKKKIRSSILFFVSIFMLFALITVPTKASESNTLFIHSEVSSEYDTYAYQNLDKYIQSISSTEGIDVSMASLGQGFRIYNTEINNSPLYYYPISIVDEITFIFKVYRDVDNALTGSITRNEANEINELKNITSENAPATFIASNDNIVARVEKKETIISTTPISGEIEIESINKWENVASSDPIFNALMPQSFARTRTYFKQINLKIDYQEKQGSLPWCAAYATANILRFIKGNPSIYASTIMNHFGLGSSSSLSHARIKEYAQYQGVSASNYITGKPSQLTVESYLTTRRPIYASMQVGNSGHALVVHGCSVNSLTVRNPWYQYSETYNYDTNTYVTGGSTVMSMKGYITFN